MLPRTTLLAVVAAAAAIAAAGTSSTVFLSAAANETGLAHSGTHTQTAADHRQNDSGTETTDAAPSAAPQLPPCPADVTSHGAYVSSVAKAGHGADAAGAATAHGKPAGEPGDHGALVSAAAQSDCGKDATDSATASKDDSESETGDDAGDATDDQGATGAGHAAGHGKAGQQHGKSGMHPTSQAPAAP